MRKETLITLSRTQFEAHIARQVAWYEAAHPQGKKNTRTSAKKNTPRTTSAPRVNSPAKPVQVPVATQDNVHERMEDLRAKFGLAFDDEDLAYATTPEG
jgi:hypothetical protein